MTAADTALKPQLGSNMRWRVAALLFVVTVINYIDRQSLAVASPVILEEFGLTTAQYGVITSAFLIAYAIGQALSGQIIDRLGVKKAFSLAVFFWSLACMAHAVGRGFASFLTARAVLGLFESANHPSAIKTISLWFPKLERSLGVGIFLAGASLGAAIAPPLLGTIIFYFGWQMAFVVSGLLGFVWIALWLAFFHLPKDHPSISSSEREYILAGQDGANGEAKRPPLKAMLARRDVIGLMLARFFGDNIFLFYTFWLPVYLSQDRGLNILEIGYFAWVPFVFTDLGSLTAGWFGGKLMKMGFSLNASRKIMLWIAAALVPMSFFAVWVDEVLLAVLLIGFAMFFNQFKSVVVVGLPADLYPSHYVATIWGFLGAAGSLGGFIVSPIIGYVVESYSFVPVFIAISFFPALSALIITLFVPQIRMMDVAKDV
ncbi:MAG: MFS transporter [Pseudomonadota bacterium]